MICKYQGCSGLTFISIPNSVISIGEWAFSSCSGLTSIKVEGGNPNYDSRNDCNAIIETASNTLIVGCQKTVIPESVTAIGEAFMGCIYLTSITIPESVTYIGTNAFASCKGLTSITIPKSVEYIGQGAFYNCFFVADSLVVENSSVDTWGEYAPTLCDKETKDGLIIKNNEVVLCRPWATSAVIPDDVTNINEYAFRGNKNLTSVTIGNGVMSIGERNFEGCSNLTSVTIPESVTSIGRFAFYGCYALETVHTADLTAWCNISFDMFDDYYDEEYIDCLTSNPLFYAHHLYMNGKEITDLVIPEGVTNINAFAFGGCSSLNSVTIGSGVTSIGKGAFMGCSSLTAVHVTDLAAWCNISYAEDISSQPLFFAHHLYMNGREITDLVIPDGVTSIGELAFVFCSGLTSITIPSSVTSIYSWSFAGCEQLTEVYCLAENVPMTDESAFESSPIKNATLYVPEGSVEAYKARYPWSEFGTIVGLTQDMIDGIEDVEDSATLNIEEAWYSLDGRRLAAPQKGINIVNGKKILK